MNQYRGLIFFDNRSRVDLVKISYSKRKRAKMSDIISGPGWYVCHTERSEENGDLRSAGAIEKCANKAAAIAAASQYRYAYIMSFYYDRKEWQRDE